MAKSKKKNTHRNKKKFPPLSKQDKFIYSCIEVIGAIILFVFVLLFESLTSFIVFRKADVLAYEQRMTVILLAPVMIFWLYLILRITTKKIPITGNKKVDYLKISEYKGVFPLFDNRYKNNEKYKKGRKEFLKKSIVHFLVFACLVTIGCMGCVGRHEFNENSIATYNILNEKISEYSYDEVESYDVSAVLHNITRTKGLSYRTYDVHLTVTMKNGDSFTASYDTAKDVYALLKIDNLLENKAKTVNSDNLEKFIAKHDFSDDEIRVINKLFEK